MKAQNMPAKEVEVQVRKPVMKNMGNGGAMDGMKH
jgi:hypothetical protein